MPSKLIQDLLETKDIKLHDPPLPPQRNLGEAQRVRNEALIRKAAVRLAKLKMEALRLYEPLPHIDDFHACRSPERILRGSNRGGKTLGAAVEVARALTGQDPYRKYPEEDGRCFIIGKDGKHNAEVLYRKLCRRGAFKVIQDKKTGLWRSWKPWVKSDKLREDEAKPAPPLIPRRMIKEISWESLKELNPNVIRLTNGWEIRFFTSLGTPGQGSDVDLVWFDEEIVNGDWYPEVAVRGTVDRGGRFIWSATAQLGGPQLYDLHLQARDQEEEKSPRIKEFFAHIDENKFFSDEQREIFYSKLTEEQRRIRIDGEFAFIHYKVYPEFDVHLLTDPFEIPSDWTRYAVVDPGRQVCAVLFAAVPPPDHLMSKHVFFFDELYLKNCNSEMLASAMREKTMGSMFQSFIIDYRGARVRMMDSGITIEQQYSEAFKRYEVSSIATGHAFHWANDDIEAGIMKFRSWLNSTKEGPPKLKVFRDALPHFEHEIQRYHYKTDKTGITDKPVYKNNHLCDCARYMAMYEPAYVKPKPRSRKDDPWRIVKSKLEKYKKEHPPQISLG
jgi:hypothetical protein